MTDNAEKYKVSIVRKNDMTVIDAVASAVELIGGFESYVQPGQRVMLKPNYTGDLSPETGAVTSVEVLEALVLLLKAHGVHDITIGEGAGCIHIGTMRIFDNVGVTAMAERCGVRVIDLNKFPAVVKTHPQFRELESVKISSEIYNYDLIINVPVIKTHAQCVATCAIKNMKGCVAPAEKRRFHSINLHQAIADFNLILPRTLNIVDGLVGQEGMGPAEGDPVPLGIIVAGDNATAVDGVVLSIMDIPVEKVLHVKLAGEMGLGSFELKNIEILGTPIADVRRSFKLAEAALTDYDGVQIYENNACSGCINSLVIALNRMQDCGDLCKFKDLQVCIGTTAPQTEYKNFYYIGKCARANYERESQKHPNVHFIAGCAPAALEIEERIRETCGIERINPFFFASKKKSGEKND